MQKIATKQSIFSTRKEVHLQVTQSKNVENAYTKASIDFHINKKDEE